jgi:pyruvate dehydrogenase E1 component alpha subunit
MHIADIDSGNLGANGIVAAGCRSPSASGMSIRMQKQDRVCMVFFGDGATNEGAFHEALNMASIWKLPVVFVCENNKYGCRWTSRSQWPCRTSPTARARTRCRRAPSTATICRRRAAAAAAIDRARSGGGPSLLECKTYRWRGHSKSDRNLYRTKEEIDAWRKRDPIRLLEAELRCTPAASRRRSSRRSRRRPRSRSSGRSSSPRRVPIPLRRSSRGTFYAG